MHIILKSSKHKILSYYLEGRISYSRYLTLKPHLNILSCRTFYYYLSTNLQDRYRKHKYILVSIFPLSFVVKVWQLIPLIPVFNSIILNEEQIYSCCHEACCMFIPQLSTFLVLLYTMNMECSFKL